MLWIYANYIVGMIKSGVYGDQIKLVTPFLCENIIWSGNLIEKIWFRSYTLNQGLFLTNSTSL
jgi:hypothetical protein